MTKRLDPTVKARRAQKRGKAFALALAAEAKGEGVDPAAVTLYGTTPVLIPVKGVGRKWAQNEALLLKVAEWAANRKTQKTIAAYLGLTIRGLEAALAENKGENPLRLAFEAGKAAAEQREIDKCSDLDPANPKHTIAWIFVRKALDGWRDRPEEGGSDAPRITYILPGSLSEADYYKKFGAPVDSRPLDKRGGPGSDMKDVTPTAAGTLPTLAPKLLGGPPPLPSV